MMANQMSDISKNMSIINELIFSIGNSLDLQENCDAFCTLLLARKNYSFVSLWLRNDVLKNGENTGDATCVYAYPLVMADLVTLSVDHPLFTLLTDGKPASYSAQDAEFQSLIVEKQIFGGAYALYPLGDFGVLKIYAWDRNEAFSSEELAQLRNVIQKFAVSVRGCLSHQALNDEVRERTLAEKRLQDSKNALQSFIDNISEPAGLIGRDLSNIVANAAFFRVHAFLRGGTCEPDTHGLRPAVMKSLREGFTRVLEKREPKNIEIEVRNRVFEIRLTPVIGSTGEGDAVAFFAVDITDKKKEMPEQLRNSERQFRELADFIPIILYECDKTGEVTFANQTSYSAMKAGSVLLGPDISLINLVVPEDVSRVESAIVEVASGGRIQGMQFSVRRLDGTTFPALVYSSPIVREGKFFGIHGAVIDISEQVMAEEALRKTNLKLSLLSSVTRHDILNQVTKMLLFKEMLADTIAAGEPVDAEHVSTILESAEIIERQLLFTRDYESIGMEKPCWQHICHVVTKVSQYTELSAIHVSSNTGTLEIYADHLFEKVVFNLIENSLRHGSHVSSMEVTWAPDACGGGMLTLADNGVGVPDEKKEQIFEKGFGSNTGYGLYLIREILGLTGITIEETGTVGIGATFSLTLPIGSWRACSSDE